MLNQAKIDALIEREGGAAFTDHPADRGGPTRWGITEQAARADGYTGPMAELSREAAVSMYLRRYWNGPGLDRIDAAAPPVAEKLFDVGVNMGTATAVRFMQRAINVLNRGATDWPDVSADGQVGPATLQAVRALVAKRGADGIAELVAMIGALQRVRYMEIAEADPRQEVFLLGWQHRASATEGAKHA